MQHTKKFHASELCGSEEQDFLIYFYAFLWFEPRTPGLGPSWTLGPSFEPGKRSIGNATYKISSI